MEEPLAGDAMEDLGADGGQALTPHRGGVTRRSARESSEPRTVTPSGQRRDADPMAGDAATDSRSVVGRAHCSRTCRSPETDGCEQGRLGERARFGAAGAEPGRPTEARPSRRTGYQRVWLANAIEGAEMVAIANWPGTGATRRVPERRSRRATEATGLHPPLPMFTGGGRGDRSGEALRQPPAWHRFVSMHFAGSHVAGRTGWERLRSLSHQVRVCCGF